MMKELDLSPTIKKDQLIKMISIFLILLMFASKISLKWTGVVPETYSYFIYQFGLHPYVNFFLNFFLGSILFFIWLRKKNRLKHNSIYLVFLYLLISTLIIQTMFQIIFVNIGQSIFFQFAGLIMAISLIILYGIIIPSLLPVGIFVTHVKSFSIILVVVSLILLPFSGLHLFRGERFIGIFKHIPHMVSTSTFAFIFLIPSLINKKNKIPWIFFLLLALIAIALTATKAALTTALIVVMSSFVLFRSKTLHVKMFKFIFVILTLMFISMFGIQISEHIIDIASGSKSFLGRPAQNGVEARLDEVYRGMKMFYENPYFGKGILYKFMSHNSLSLGGYNSFKDPHNMFVSAGVVGGYPLFVLSIFAFILMLIGTVKEILIKSASRRVIGIFMLSHLPVFLIYHVHFSIGGLADRMYWLVFGYSSLLYFNQYKYKKSA